MHKDSKDAAVAKQKWYEDKPMNMGDYEKHWKKKSKGCYMLGLGRWFRVCRENTSKDIEGKTKLFQVIMMILFGLASIGMTILLWANVYSWNYPYVDPTAILVIAFSNEFGLGFIASTITYAFLAR